VEFLALTTDRIAELEAKRAELHKRFPSTWAHNDLHIGRITSDGAALMTFAKAAGEVPVHPRPRPRGRGLSSTLLGQEREAEAKAHRAQTGVPGSHPSPRAGIDKHLADLKAPLQRSATPPRAAARPPVLLGCAGLQPG
jgi:hypothetical protein